MKLSEEIRNALEKKNVRYFASDNISDYIDGNDIETLIYELESAFELVLDRMVIDWRNDPKLSGYTKTFSRNVYKRTYAW